MYIYMSCGHHHIFTMIFISVFWNLKGFFSTNFKMTPTFEIITFKISVWCKEYWILLGAPFLDYLLRKGGWKGSVDEVGGFYLMKKNVVKHNKSYFLTIPRETVEESNSC